MDLSAECLFSFCDGVCNTPSNVLLMSFQFILSGEYQQSFDLNFKQALRDVQLQKGIMYLKAFVRMSK